MAGFDRILVPTDFSAASHAALAYACRLADALQASLTLLHVVEAPYPVSAFSEYYSLPQDFFDGLDRQTRHALEAELTPEQRERYRATLEMRHGVPAQEIVEYLEEHDEIAMVVMATHGRGGVARLMMGSVTDRLVRTAPCPVLTIRISDTPAETVTAPVPAPA